MIFLTFFFNIVSYFGYLFFVLFFFVCLYYIFVRNLSFFERITRRFVFRLIHSVCLCLFVFLFSPTAGGPASLTLSVFALDWGHVVNEDYHAKTTLHFSICLFIYFCFPLCVIYIFYFFWYYYIFIYFGFLMCQFYLIAFTVFFYFYCFFYSFLKSCFCCDYIFKLRK